MVSTAEEGTPKLTNVKKGAQVTTVRKRNKTRRDQRNLMVLNISEKEGKELAMKTMNNKFLKVVKQELRLHYSLDFVEKTMQKAGLGYEKLLLENSKESKPLRVHTESRIYPAIACFEALLAMGVERKKAVSLLTDFFRKRSTKIGEMIRRILRFPGLYRLIPKLFAKMTPKYFGEPAGFQAHFWEQSKTAVKFDMLVCPYYDICKKYGCPEIVAMFCDADDACYGNMHPKVQWLRTKTLGKGGDCCDFEVRVAENKRKYLKQRNNVSA